MSGSQSIPVIIPHIAFDNTLGAELIGVLVSVLLYGIFLMQVYAYSQTFQNDKKYLKYTVYTLLLTTTLSTVFICHGIYYYTVTNYTNPLSLRRSVWSLIYSVIPDFITVALVEFSFAVRVYKLSGHQKKMFILIMTLSLLSTGAKIVSVVETGLHPFAGDEPGKDEQVPACVALALNAVCTCVISILQAYYLHKGRTGIKRTNEIINVLIVYTISTGSLTSITAIFALAFLAVMPDNTIFWAFVSVSSGAYANAMLAFLNGRRNLQSEMPASNTVDLKNLDQASNPSVCNDKTGVSIVDSAVGTFDLSETTLAAQAEGRKSV